MTTAATADFVTSANELAELPDAIRQWIHQILTTPNLDVMVAAGGPVEVRLFANRGSSRKQPVIVLNNGAGDVR